MRAASSPARWRSLSSLISTSFRSVPMSAASMATLPVPPRYVIDGAGHRSGTGRAVSGRSAVATELQLAIPPERAYAAGEVDPSLPAPSCHQRFELVHVARGQRAGRAAGGHRRAV